MQAGGAATAGVRRTIEQCHHRSTELKDFMNSMFTAVTTHRFRSVSWRRAEGSCCLENRLRFSGVISIVATLRECKAVSEPRA